MNFGHQELQQLREEAYWSQGTREHRTFDLASASYYGEPNLQFQSQLQNFGFRDDSIQLPRIFLDADPRYTFSAKPGGSSGQLESLQLQASNSTNYLTSEDGQQNQYSTSSGGDQLEMDYSASLNQLGGNYSGSSDQQTDGGDDESLSWLTNGLMTRLYGEQKTPADQQQQQQLAVQLPEPAAHHSAMQVDPPPIKDTFAAAAQQVSLGAGGGGQGGGANQQLLPSVKLSSRDLLGLQGCYDEPSSWQYPSRGPDQLTPTPNPRPEEALPPQGQATSLILKHEPQPQQQPQQQLLPRSASGGRLAAAPVGSEQRPPPGLPRTGSFVAMPATHAQQQQALQQQQLEQSKGHGGDFWVTRAESLKRYQGKKDRRLFAKTIRYEKRKANADKRPRVKGRFVKSVGPEAAASPGPADGKLLAAAGDAGEESDPSEDTGPHEAM